MDDGATQSSRYSGNLDISAGERIAHIEGRLASLESRASPSNAQESGFWRSVFTQALPLIVSGAVATLLGYAVLERTKHDLAERELMAGNLEHMAEPMLTLQKGGDKPGEITAAAMLLANYGRYAVGPLIAAIETGVPERVAAAESALPFAAMLDHHRTCELLASVIDNRTGAYTFATHKRVLAALGTSGCTQAIPSIRAYKTLLGQGVEIYTTQVRYSLHEETAANIEQLKIDLDNILKRLERQSFRNAGP